MRKIIIIIVAAAVLLSGLCVLANHPIISDKSDVPSLYLDAIESQAKGVYSRVLPFAPVYVSVDSVSTDRVCYTIYYFPLGTVGMSYSESDGYNIEKPLTNQ